ncbi:MAG: TatD family hydrolase [Deltaproteobacteria bacterium]|nr:TatD family hydrolase [Deltaproteobacteria bacterium]
MRDGSISIVDTHAHLCDAAFDIDRPEVLSRARSAGVSSIVACSENLDDARKNLELATLFPMLKPAAGLYPTFLDYDQAEEIAGFIREMHSSIYAIGEVGLDHWIIKEVHQQEIQKEIFSFFIDLAIELDLPLNVHSRSAGRHAVDLLLKRGAKKVQLHAFDARASTALPAVEAGFLFSIPPSVVRSRQKQKLLKQLPLASLMAETDSPVLGPDPQKRNEPANVTKVISAIADIKNISSQEVLDTIFTNTCRLYGNMTPCQKLES